ncbi:transposable element Tcb1 transposase [Trichonephila clavipes]|nr:transposable element Tcb1 transposase [Trichonephila clavipes]
MLLPRSNHWEVGGRPQCDKCGCRVQVLLTASFHDFGENFRLQEQLSGGSVVVVHEEPHPQMTGTLSYRPEEAGGRQREKSLDTRHRRLDDRYRVYRGQKTARWWSVCDALYDESRFSLVAILIAYSSGESGEAAIIPRTSLKGTGMEIAVFSFGEASCLVVVQTFTSSTHVQSTGPVIVTRFFFHMCVFLEALWVCSSLFMDDNAPCHRTVAAEQLLESEDIERMDWPARSPDLNPIEHVWDFSRQTLGSSYLTTSNDSGASIGAARRMGSNASTTH